MKHWLTLFFISLFSFSHWAMISPFYKEVMQRGYEIIPGDSVKFPDGSSCPIQAFNEGTCGQKWMTEDYCISEGEPVWDENRCCEGLSPYLEDGSAGQATCQQEESSFISSRSILYFFMGVLIPLSLFVILAIYVKKRLPK